MRHPRERVFVGDVQRARHHADVNPVVQRGQLVILPRLVCVVVVDARFSQLDRIALQQLPFVQATHLGACALAENQRRIYHAFTKQRPLPVDDGDWAMPRLDTEEDVPHTEIAMQQGNGPAVHGGLQHGQRDDESVALGGQLRSMKSLKISYMLGQPTCTRVAMLVAR